jgi:hypothetical protein
MYNLAAAPTCSSSTGFIETIPIPASTTARALPSWSLLGKPTQPESVSALRADQARQITPTRQPACSGRFSTNENQLLGLFGLLASVCASAAVTSPIVRDAKLRGGGYNLHARQRRLRRRYGRVYAYRTTTTAPTLPASWTSITTASASGSSFRVGCQKGTSGSSSGHGRMRRTSLRSLQKCLWQHVYDGKLQPLLSSETHKQRCGQHDNVLFRTVRCDQERPVMVIGVAGADLPLRLALQGTQAVTSIASAGTGPGVAAWDTNAGVAAWGTHTCTVASSSWRS